MTKNRARNICRGKLLLLALFVVAALTAPAAAFGAEALELIPGVLVAPERDSVFLMLPEGGIAEVRADNGKEVWRTTRAAAPLAIHDSHLLAQADCASSTLKLRVFDLRNPDEAPIYIDYELPGGARASVDNEMFLRFRVTGLVHDDRFHVVWNFGRSRSQLQPGYAEEFKTSLGGALRIDLEQRKAVSVDAARLQASETAKSSRRPDGAAGLTSALRTADGISAGLDVQGKPGTQRQATLKRWDAADGQALEEVELAAGDVRRWVFAADDRHVLLGSLQADADPGERYLWTIYSMSSGEQLGQIARPVSGAKHMVEASTLLYMTPPMARRSGDEMVSIPVSVEAVTLDSGRTSWSRDVRDTAYRGPYPKRLPTNPTSGPRMTSYGTKLTPAPSKQPSN